MHKLQSLKLEGFKEKNMFFFEKKNQKALISFAAKLRANCVVTHHNT